MTYSRDRSVDANPGGDSTKQAVLDVDDNLTDLFSHLNTHEGLTTGIHGAGASTIATTDNIATHAALQTGVHGIAITAGKTLTVTESETFDAVYTGTGTKVKATSPTLVTPNLGTPASGDLSNCTLSTPPAIGETTPNSIRGTNKEVYKTANADSPLTATQCAGTIVSNYGMTDADCSITLPAAAEGLSFVCTLPAVRARYFRLQSAGTDKIYLLGVAGTGPGYVGVASGYAANSQCSMFTTKSTDGGYDWNCIPIFGAWVAG
jgi:hypothetical protein